MAEALQQGEALPEATHEDMANAIRAEAEAMKAKALRGNYRVNVRDMYD